VARRQIGTLCQRQAGAPKELTEQFKNIFNPKLNRKPRPDQALFRAWPQPRSGLPTCEGCLQTLYFYSDTSDLPAWNPYQLFEFTLGAQIDSFKIGPDDVRNGLDIGNLDFDMSYVNIAHFGAALGPFQNNQVGFVGTPQPIADFIKSVNQFLADNPGWPRYIDPDQQVKDPGSPPKPTEPPKVASPLEVFLRLAGTLLFRLPICSRSRRTGPLCCGTLSKSCGQIGTDGA
jgi:hypothetical protein